MEQAIALQKRIVKLEARQAELLAQLGRALEIKAIWPEAFDAGSCTFSGLLAWDKRFNVTNSFRCAWFERADGVRRYLTAEELQQFKPDAKVNQCYTTDPY